MSNSSTVAGGRIGPYQVLERLGKGGMGEVYRAHDARLGRDVAIKILPPAFTTNPERLARFEREARILATLNHSHIGAIYGVEDLPPLPGSEQQARGRALVLELVEGPTLADRLLPGPLPIEEALTIARQIAEALEAAHEKGIVHRDLKPANIKVTPTGMVKVLDFGLAKDGGGSTAGLLDSPTITMNATGEGVILGTAAYMSPEQTKGLPVDRRADLWAFGAVLYEMLTASTTFAGDSVSDTLARILMKEPNWEALPPETPPAIRRLLRRCLEKNPRQRLDSAAQARLEIDDALAPPAADAASGSLVPRRRIALVAVPTIGAAALIIAVVIGVFVAQGNRDDAQPVFRQLTFRHGSLRGARLANDGQTVVYGAAWIGTPPQVYVIRPESPQAGSIGLANSGVFSVSSKGEVAVALGCRLNWGECIGTLGRVPITGGTPRELVRDVHVADWSPDGERIAIVSFAGGQYRLEYPIGKVLYEPAGWITAARVSPRGDRVAFLDHPQLGDIGGSVAVLDTAGKKTTLSSDWKSLQGLAWSSTGDEVWFTGSRSGKGGSSSLYAVTLAGRERTVFSSPGTLKLNDISRDGQVLLTRGTTRRGIMAVGADDAKERELSWFDYSTVADLSADGKTLLFYEWGEGVGAKATIFIRKTDGGDAVRLGEGRPLALSPDGQWALAVQNDEPAQLLLLPTGTGDVRRMTRGNVAEYLDWATWSRDGRRIYFAARDTSDVRRTYVQDVDGGEPRPVTPDGFVGLLLSPDGLTLATIDRYGEYYIYPVDGGVDPRPLPGYEDGDVLLQWSADSRSLYIREAGNLVLRLHRLEISTGDRQFWKELVPPDPTVLIDIGSDPGQVRLTADGKSYAYTYWTFDGELYLAEGLK